MRLHHRKLSTFGPKETGPRTAKSDLHSLKDYQGAALGPQPHPPPHPHSYPHPHPWAAEPQPQPARQSGSSPAAVTGSHKSKHSDVLHAGWHVRSRPQPASQVSDYLSNPMPLSRPPDSHPGERNWMSVGVMSLVSLEQHIFAYLMAHNGAKNCLHA